tara:strand:+ start:842 stop:1543 length:702 start_codon:yes stop_codon:yes gene_type:complete
MLKPFFSYYGAKYRASAKYPEPTHQIIIEPFAGSAGYAARYYERDVLLIDSDPVVASVWGYLIQASPDDIMSLPLLEPGQSTHTLDVCEGARNLIGFWLNKGNARPASTMSAWGRDARYARQFWGKHIRERIAAQVDCIKHWKVICADYSAAPDVRATWFVDSPYQVMGRHYRHKFSDFDALGTWCKQRDGQLIVCENVGADWLPFKDFARIKANESRHGGKRSHEAIYTQGK